MLTLLARNTLAETVAEIVGKVNKQQQRAAQHAEFETRIAMTLGWILALLAGLNIAIWFKCRKTVAVALAPNGPPGTAYIDEQQSPAVRTKVDDTNKKATTRLKQA